MKKAFFVSAILSFILSLSSLDVQASLTDEETVVLARATSGGKKRLAAAIVAAGYTSLDEWLDSLAAPVVPPVDADIQGLLATLGPIPVGTVPLTRTQQALNLRNKLDNTTGTVEQAMASTEAKFAGLPGAGVVQQADSIVDALDSTLVGVNRTLDQGLAVIADMKANLGNDGDFGAHIVGAPRTAPGNYPLINSVTSTLAPKVDFADGRDIATYLAHINQ